MSSRFGSWASAESRLMLGPDCATLLLVNRISCHSNVSNVQECARFRHHKADKHRSREVSTIDRQCLITGLTVSPSCWLHIGLTRQWCHVLMQDFRKLQRLMTAPKVQPCGLCNTYGLWHKCQVCANIYYCGRDCQLKDWHHHKAACAASAAED